MYKNKFEIDFLDVEIEINHDPEKLSSCYQIFSNSNYNFDDSKISYSAKKIYSEFGSVIKVKTFSLKDELHPKLKMSGNFYKWLNGHNVTGCNSLEDLIIQVVVKLESMGLVKPTKEQLETIRLGHFRIYKVDVKKDIIFESKQNAKQYLSHLNKYAICKYKKKAIFENGVYFNMTSKRWSICCYYKGKEVEDNSHKSKTSTELKALADLMIRQEIRIYSKQLSEWDMMFGHQWLDLNYIDNFFSKILNQIYIPEIILKDSNNNIKDNHDRQFYNCLINGDIQESYSKSTINRKRKIFLDKYNIDINNY